MSLFSHGKKNRKYCTACSLPNEEQERLGIHSPYANQSTKDAINKRVTETYKKPLNLQTLQAITGEHNVKPRSS